MSTKSKSYTLYPLPTTILKQCLDTLLPILVRIINKSFQASQFPADLKLAIVIPLLKKIILDWENKKNYRPVSNLPYLGKVIEKVAVKRFGGHITLHDLVELLQSAYKELHSVETALLKVYDDLLCAVDAGKCIMITLLDFSAAFDTIDHNILFRRLESSYGVSNEALKWVKSYFSSRFQSVIISGVTSDKHALPYGMPQGSMLGPFSYPKYSSPMARIAEKHGVQYHLYADDTQLYVVFDRDDVEIEKEKLERCISEMKDWVTSNKLKLNETKTEFLVIRSKHGKHTPDVSSVCVGGSAVSAVHSARNIGVVMDDRLTMTDQVDAICKASYAQLRAISHIRRYLTQDAAATLVHSLVTSKLDNMNSLLYGLPDNIINKLQYIQNHAAKLVTKKKKFDHVTPLLHSLHWLPVPYRIDYKLLLLTHKCVHGKAPGYLSALLQTYTPGRTLRSANQYLLTEKKSRLKLYGDRAFSVAAPKLWNSLPLELRQCDSTDCFKAKLKTVLFKKAF